jgi:hypothetical protein
MGTTAQKLNRVLETKSDLKTVINYSGANITNETTFKDYPKLLNKAYIDILNDEGEFLYNALPKTTGTGTSIDLDVEKGKMKIKLNATEVTQDGTPTPDYPQDIHVVTGDNKVNIVNKNLFTGANLTSQTKFGVTTTFDNSKITFNGTSTAGVIFAKSDLGYKLKAGTYTFHFEDISGNYQNPNNKDLAIFLTNSSSDTAFGNVNLRRTRPYITFTITEETEIYLYMYINGEIIFDNWTIGFQIEKGSTPTNYVEHQEQNYPLSLGSLEYCKMEDYHDYIYNQNGDWYLHKEIGKTNINTSTITLRSDYSNIEYAIIPKASDYVGYDKYGNYKVICTHALFSNNPSNWNSVGNFGKMYSGAQKNLWWLGFEKGTGLDNIKAKLSNSIVYYPLTNPIEIQITDTNLIQQLDNLKNAKSYDDVTHITQTNDDLSFNLEVSALAKIE